MFLATLTRWLDEPPSSRRAPVASKATAPAAAPVERDDRRITALVHAHFDLVWRALRRAGVPEAGVDDAAQQVFLVAARRLGDIAPGAEKSFLYQTALRVASDARRAAARANARTDDGASLDRVEDPSPSPEEATRLRRARDTLQAILDDMPDDLRAAFVLFELEAMPVKEIAEVLEIPQGTAASRLRRAREHFEEAVKRIGARDAFRGGVR